MTVRLRKRRPLYGGAFIPVLAAGFFFCGSLPAQENQEPEYDLKPPPKNVVVVDVSGSMSPKNTGTRVGEARQIITAIVSGKGVSGLSFMNNWTLAGTAKDKNLQEAFSNYFTPAFTGPLNPLMEKGNRLSVGLAGNFNTVIQNTLQQGRDDYTPRKRIPQFITLASADSFEGELSAMWPDTFTDQSTCYKFAVARAAREWES